MTNQEIGLQLAGFCIAAIVGGLVSADARRRGLKISTALLWGFGVTMALIIFLPLYLLHRAGMLGGNKPAPKPFVMSACPYCGYVNNATANFCEKCNRQLKSSQEIHSKST